MHFGVCQINNLDSDLMSSISTGAVYKYPLAVYVTFQTSSNFQTSKQKDRTGHSRGFKVQSINVQASPPGGKKQKNKKTGTHHDGYGIRFTVYGIQYR